ncbi:MAG: hemolysin III family protein [Clostridiales bacterium]|nr:hemolysin III family protein [Clostridiales bacterium]
MVNQGEQPKHRISVPKYTLGEELINAISHGFGVILGIVAMILCLVRCSPSGDAYQVVSSVIFGVTVIILYLMSCLYHALKVNKAKRVFRVIDHCTIFLLIAGTYTPFSLVALRPTVGWWVFGIIWATAVLGIVLNAISLKRFAKLSMALYLIMGWIIIIAYQAMIQAIPGDGMALLVWGGVAYSVGAILYGIGSKKKYFHSIFHFLCLAGTFLHFLAIYLYVL